jgi:hypothetical protein
LFCIGFKRIEKEGVNLEPLRGEKAQVHLQDCLRNLAVAIDTGP